MTLPSNTLPTLADEIAAVLPLMLPVYVDGPSLKDIAQAIGADIASVRKASVELNSRGRANLMRRLNSREQFLVPVKYRVDGLRTCSQCRSLFPMRYQEKSGKLRFHDRRTCSDKCHRAAGWTDENRGRRCAALSAAQSTPKALARIVAHNKQRWSKPGERERLAEQNRREWADPVKKALRSQSIAKVNGQPHMRKFYSELRKQHWADPVKRQKMYEAATRSQRTQAYRKKLSTLTRERWRDPVWRKKWTEANRRKAGNRKGHKQSADHVAKRVNARKRNSATALSSPIPHHNG